MVTTRHNQNTLRIKIHFLKETTVKAFKKWSFSQFIVRFCIPSSSCFLAIFSCHFDGHPRYLTFGIPTSFTSTSKADTSIKYAIVEHLNKRRPDNVIITSVYFWGINMWKPPEFLWTYLTSDLSSMSGRQQINAAAMEGSQLVLTHRLQFRLTGPCLLRGNNEWVRRSDYYKWFWLVLTMNGWLNRILHLPLHT